MTLKLNPDTVAEIEADNRRSIRAMAPTYRREIVRLQGMIDEKEAAYKAGEIEFHDLFITRKTFETPIKEMKSALKAIGEEA